MKRQDIAAVVDLLKDYLKTFTVAPVVDVHFVEHFLLPKQGLVDSYVVQDPETQKITDFCSFVIQKKEITKKRKRWEKRLIYSERRELWGMIFFLDKLKFETVPYKKVLHYYLYNYGLMNVLRPKELGLVLL
ncbi:glycylpeptide N-tetradecanoyltransferase 1-like [Dendrobium catenatum]|uniref:glycylpeptide N-tetradecanoyltransferase 1-like n=1 Tax=Dendrobium catenatum TaxID=906689 RepID=UPI0009F1870D|nr:glycylpeptide N-tetradecanoyltransferase 1-like [Dendrobium catenatum]